ncbi:hypothetical protein EVAR_87872_1 [Eumeta japonica]|uniref:Uncharacterized protein n=1 Tax=Eumeta variegata TaxID=151549 RepID=A0A4C1WX97_EUMVA|nr:hypothetical protein EVAR_87872_1 [Eumeta japonica]
MRASERHASLPLGHEKTLKSARPDGAHASTRRAPYPATKILKSLKLRVRLLPHVDGRTAADLSDTAGDRYVRTSDNRVGGFGRTHRVTKL